MDLKMFREAPVPVAVHGAGVSILRDLHIEPPLDMEEIQADILLGHRKTEEAIIFFKIIDAEVFSSMLRAFPITSSAEVFRPDPEQKVALLTNEKPPNPRYSIAFSWSGLQTLSNDPQGGDDLLQPLQETLTERAVDRLNDPEPENWVIGRPDQDIDGVLIITGAERFDVDDALAKMIADPSASGFDVVGEILRGKVRPGGAEGHEHFGFLDGVSQPGIRGRVEHGGRVVPLTRNENLNEPDQGLPGQDLLWPGEFVLGYPTQKVGAKFTEKGEPVTLPGEWMRNGSFLVVRRLTQLVPEMHDGIKQELNDKGIIGQTPEQFEAQIVGRWPNGAPVVTHPDADDRELGTDPHRNNDFEFGNDRNGLTCPWAAHIRKAYPRDDVIGEIGPEEERIDEAEADTQTHRMLRRGIQFGEELSLEEHARRETLQDRGLLFKCYVADIADQFEFVQQSWCNNPHFVQPESGHDPIIGQAPGGVLRRFAGVGYEGHKPEFNFQPWVTMTGGGYFFAPSLSFIRSLGTVETSDAPSAATPPESGA